MTLVVAMWLRSVQTDGQATPAFDGGQNNVAAMWPAASLLCRWWLLRGYDAVGFNHTGHYRRKNVVCVTSTGTKYQRKPQKTIPKHQQQSKKVSHV